MTYAGVQDMIQAFGEAEILAVAGTGERPNRAVDQGKVLGAITDACAEIDGYLGRRFLVPVAPTPPRLMTLALDIARYRLRNRAEGVGGNAADVVRDRYKDAIRTLEGMRDGKILLEGAKPRAGQTGSRISIHAEPPVYSGTGPGLKGYCRGQFC